MIKNTDLLGMDHVVKRYRSVPALEVKRFALQFGSRVLVSGRNGTGKSTFLRILAGLSSVTEGRVSRSPAFLRLRIAMVPQNGGLYPHLTLAENLAIWARLYDRQFGRVAACGHLKTLGLFGSMDRKVGDLSGGYQRLVALASALSVEPDGLLLDEPLNGLDDGKAEAVRSTLERIAPAKAFLVVTGHPQLVLPFLTETLDLD